MLAGLIVFSVFGAAAAAQVFTGRLGERTRWTVGLLALTAGMAVLVVAMHIASLPVFVLAGIAAGAGAGVLFKSAVAHVAGTASVARRAVRPSPSLFFTSYLGLALLPVGLGVATRSMTVTMATTWFTGVVLVLLAAVAVLTRGHGSTTRSRTASTTSTGTGHERQEAER